MAGVSGRSGGHNRLTSDEHRLRGNYRADRHAHLTVARPEPVSAADRRRTLRGLPRDARRLAASLLDEYHGWDGGSLETVRSYVLSVSRLEALQMAAEGDTRAIHRETRCTLALLKSLNLEGLR
jgi:hypothetical protein